MTVTERIMHNQRDASTARWL